MVSVQSFVNFHNHLTLVNQRLFLIKLRNEGPLASYTKDFVHSLHYVPHELKYEIFSIR